MLLEPCRSMEAILGANYDRHVRIMLIISRCECVTAGFNRCYHLYIALRAIGGFFDNVTARPPSGLTSGIVVSGFGDRDMFPAMVVLHVEGIIQDRLKLRPDHQEISLDHNNVSVVMPFAQIDMVYQFMEGIAPDYLPFLHRSMVSHLTAYSSDLLELIKNETGIYTDDLGQKLMGYYP